MRVLWFSVTPSLYSSKSNQHNGGGWIESLERIIRLHSNIELAILFIDNNSSEWKVMKDGVLYYPINLRRDYCQKILDLYTSHYIDEKIINSCLEVVKDFNPDLIHIFGSEWCFGLLKDRTLKPIVIHIQGSWPAYRNAQFPPGFSKLEKMLKLCLKPHRLVYTLLTDRLSKERALREERILRINTNYMGRTRWDRAIVKLYNPDAEYYYCSEALRSVFSSEQQKWHYEMKSKFVIITIGAGHVLKGYDLILKTAKLIKENSNLIFEWKLCGATASEMLLFENKTNIKCSEVDVKPLGVCSADVIKEILLNGSLMVHPSYIDNSPNSVCEAQILGLPIICTNVGGTPSLFSRDYPQDMFVPTNDPYYLASKIIQLSQDKTLNERMSNLNYIIARERHNVDSIYKDLYTCYKAIMQSNLL